VRQVVRAGRNSRLPQKEKANRSLGTVGFFSFVFYCRGDFVSPEGGRLTSSAFALARTRKSIKV
jgi:hypothetical protein